jgi:hypothetical protein
MQRWFWVVVGSFFVVTAAALGEAIAQSLPGPYPLPEVADPGAAVSMLTDASASESAAAAPFMGLASRITVDPLFGTATASMARPPPLRGNTNSLTRQMRTHTYPCSPASPRCRPRRARPLSHRHQPPSPISRGSPAMRAWHPCRLPRFRRLPEPARCQCPAWVGRPPDSWISMGTGCLIFWTGLVRPIPAAWPCIATAGAARSGSRKTRAPLSGARRSRTSRGIPGWSVQASA